MQGRLGAHEQLDAAAEQTPVARSKGGTILLAVSARIAARTCAAPRVALGKSQVDVAVASVNPEHLDHRPDTRTVGKIHRLRDAAEKLGKHVALGDKRQVDNLPDGAIGSRRRTRRTGRVGSRLSRRHGHRAQGRDGRRWQVRRIVAAIAPGGGISEHDAAARALVQAAGAQFT